MLTPSGPFTPSSERVRHVDFEYRKINIAFSSGISADSAVATGRYPEDSYYNGNVSC